MLPSSARFRDLVLIGAGHAHVEVLRRFARQPESGLRLTVIAREPHTPYSGMLPGVIAGQYEAEEALIDLAPLAHAAGARLYMDEAIGVDLARGTVTCAARPDVPFDLLSLNTGITPALDVPGAARFALPVKPIGRFLPRLRALEQRIALASRRFEIVVVGAGAGGTEIALSLAARFGTDVRVTLVSRNATILPGLACPARRAIEAAARRRGLSIVAGNAVIEVFENAVRLADGTNLAADAVIWATGAAAPGWLRDTGLPLDERGFLRVDQTLQSVGDERVFAAGDVASLEGRHLPKAGVWAVRAGPVLADNLRRSLRGEALRRWRPQRRALALIGTGDGRAVAAWGPFSAEGAWVWRWKDRIDRRFMARYAMVGSMASVEPMTCRGCAAKPTSITLEAALGSLGLNERDDAAILDGTDAETLLQSVDLIPSFLDDAWTFARIAAVHALNDLHASNAAPSAALAVIVLPETEPRPERLLCDVLTGLAEVLREEGLSLRGGHTATGAELMVGLAVTGRARAGAVWRKGPLRPGDALVLTKPLGTGVLMAARLRGAAKARWIEAAITSMLRPAGPVAAILREHGTTACTDVSGFGLYGHLREMLAASPDVAVRLDLAALPALAGAPECLARGIESTAAPANRATADPALASDPAAKLLFDPQTAGGLLAALPSNRADACVAALRALGETAAIIGVVRHGSVAGRQPIAAVGGRARAVAAPRTAAAPPLIGPS